MNKNRGSAVVEVCVTIPLFLFFMLFIIHVYRMMYVDAHIHQGLAEAAIYCAEQCYLEDRMLSTAEENNGKTEATLINTGLVYMQFLKYMGDDPLLDQVVVGGKNGVIITVLPDTYNRKVFIAKADYSTRINIPILCNYYLPRSLKIKQKAFLGYDDEDRLDNDDIYVYVTPNESVYHSDRGCSHLKRTVREVSGHSGYTPCSFCVEENNERVYVTDNGGAYHNDPKCLGLKRTVMRVKKSSVAMLKPCSRCGR